MTTQTSSDSAKDRRTTTAAADDDAGLAKGARQVADTVASAAGEVSARIPEVAQGTRDALTEANRVVRRGSDHTLELAGAGAVGLAIGLLLGGASRLLVLLALVPAGLIGATLMERSGDTTTSATRLQGR